MMRALVKSKSEKGIWMQEVAPPQLGVNDVLIKIKKTSICGTDLHIYKWDNWARNTVKVPTVIGHEYVGIIEKVGQEVEGITEGERVTGEGHIACGMCRNCRRGRKHICENTVGVGVNQDGAFAEYLVIPASNVVKVNNKIPDDIVAIMDPLGNATHTALSFRVLGEDVLITGAGPIGNMISAICKFAGARNIVVSDPNEYRRNLAQKMGATRVMDPITEKFGQVMPQLGMSRGFDIGLECSGAAPALNNMITHMYHGGKIALLGILPQDTSINWNDIIFRGLTLKGIYGREMFETWYMMIQMLLSGLDISPIITHRLPIEAYQEGFEIMESGNCGKVILEW
ncbi:MAG: L-threonine 3-dehydrogenase [Candidatus Cyclobacteriaceae bacterium M3_2C_046]